MNREFKRNEEKGQTMKKLDKLAEMKRKQRQ